MNSVVRLIGAACLIALGVAGCGGPASPADPADVPAAPAPTDAVAADLVATDVPSCWPTEGLAFEAGTEADPTTVVVLGEGDRGIVLGPQNGESMCQWAAQAERLADQGYLVASFTWTDDGSIAFWAAVAVLAGLGAGDYALVGASKGGAYAAGMSTLLDPPPVAVVALGPPDEFGIDARYESVGYTGPLLVIASTDDASVDVEASRRVARPDDPESFVELSGSAHGVALFDGEHRAEVEELIDGFLAAAFAG
jgi:hypothetical protein